MKKKEVHILCRQRNCKGIKRFTKVGRDRETDDKKKVHIRSDKERKIDCLLDTKRQSSKIHDRYRHPVNVIHCILNERQSYNERERERMGRNKKREREKEDKQKREKHK